LSEAIKGVSQSQEFKERHAVGMREWSQSLTEEDRKRMGDHTRGKAGFFLGRRHSPETKEKISLAKKGKPTARLGMRHSVESKLKMSMAHRAKHAQKLRTLEVA
jgi:hypothetical protein